MRTCREKFIKKRKKNMCMKRPRFERKKNGQQHKRPKVRMSPERVMIGPVAREVSFMSKQLQYPELMYVITHLNQKFYGSANKVPPIQQSAGFNASVMCCIYFDRLQKMGERNLAGKKSFIFTALLIGVKLTEDDVFTNKWWSKHIARTTLEQVNEFEKLFCKMINYNVFVTKEAYDEYLLKM